MFNWFKKLCPDCKNPLYHTCEDSYWCGWCWTEFKKEECLKS